MPPPPPSEKRTTISMYASTRDRLKSYGRKGETYDELIVRLLDEIDRAKDKLGSEVEFEPIG